MRLLLVLGVLCSGPGLSQSPQPFAVAGNSYFLPTAANTEGAFGARFRTRLYIRDSSSGVGVGGPLLVVAATPSGPLTAQLPVANTYMSDNFLEEVFHYSGGAALSISRIGGTAPFALRAEVYTEGPSGVSTTPIPTLSLADVVVSQQEPSGALSIALGVSSDSRNRLNVGCANFDSSPATVTASLFTLGGRAAWYDEFSLQPGQWYQTPVQDQSIEPGSSVYFRQTGSVTAAVFCYAVNVDDLSNDGTLVPAVPFSPRQSDPYSGSVAAPHPTDAPGHGPGPAPAARGGAIRAGQEQ